MKTHFLTLGLLLLSLSIYASTASSASYVITSHDTTICQQVIFGPNDISVVFENGSVVKYNQDEIVAYKSDGKQFEKKEIYINNKPSGRKAFMELVSFRNGLSLYKYRLQKEMKSEFGKSLNDSYDRKNILYVFRNNDYYLQLTNANGANMLDYFHIDGTIFE